MLSASQEVWLNRTLGLYRAALVVLPAHLRDRYGDQLVSTFRDVSTHSIQRHGWPGAVSVWGRMFLELFLAAPRERLSNWQFFQTGRQRSHRQDSHSNIGDFMTTFAHNVRLALRQLRRNPVFALAAIGTLALSIGANTAIFTVLHSVILQRLSYDQPDEIAAVWLEFRRPGSTRGREIVASEPEYLEFRNQTTSFASVAAYWVGETNLGGIEEPARVGSAGVSANFLETLRVTPTLGRSFIAGDDIPGAEPVALLTHGLWVRSFGADSGIVGSTVLVNGVSSTVVGILPQTFRFPGHDVQLIRPNIIDTQNPEGRASHYLSILGRLQPGVTLATARAETEVLMNAWRSEFPEQHGPSAETHPLVMTSLHERLVGDVRPALNLLSGAVGLVLLIACANVAGLMLARAETRHREMAIRTAIGAGRSRLVSQMLTESVVIALLGGALGLGLAQLGVNAIVTAGPADLPRQDNLSMNFVVLAFTALISLITGIAFGIAPAIAAARSSVAHAFKESSTGSTTGRRRLTFRRTLIVSEIAIALVLAIGAALLIKSLAQLRRTDPGFDPTGVVTMEFSLNSALYPETTDVARFHRNLNERLAAIPGVTASGAVRRLPLTGSPGFETLSLVGRPSVEDGPSWNAQYQVASAGFFDALSVPIKAGRKFNERDGESSPPVAITNERMAQLFWPDEDAIGQQVQVGNFPDNANPVMTIVGVVGDVRQASLVEDVNPQLFVPRQQAGAIYGGFVTRVSTLAVRADTDPSATILSVRNAIGELDPNLPLANIQTMQHVLSRSMSDERFTSTVMGLFSGLALILGAVGIYGLMAYSVAQQTREIGVRMALGADGRSVRQAVVKHGLILSMTGIGIGLLVALGLSRFMSGLVFNLGVRDPFVFGSIPLLLFVTSLLAAYLPARKAAAVDLRTYRQEKRRPSIR